MATGPATRRRARWVLGSAVLVAVLVAGAGGFWVWWRQAHQGQAMNVPDDDLISPFAPWPTPPPREAAPQGPPFVTSVSPNGRYFLDQYGRPLLLEGDSPGP